MARFSLPTWVPRNLLRPWARSSAHLGPLQLCGSWGSGREGRGSKSKGRTSGTSTPEGWLGEGRSSYTQQDPPTVRGPAGMGETLGEMVGEGCEGTEGNEASAFPVHIGTKEPVGLPGLILCPWSLPRATQSPSPAPTPPPRAPPLHSETPSNALGLNTTHTPSLRDPPPNSGTPHSRGPPFHMLPVPLCTGPKHRPHPTLEHHPA